MDQSILATGGAGNIGSALTRAHLSSEAQGGAVVQRPRLRIARAGSRR